MATAFTTLTLGAACPAASVWGGRQTAVVGDRIGMLLDLDHGSMTIYKNDKKLGVMMTEGLSGDYC